MNEYRSIKRIIPYISRYKLTICFASLGLVLSSLIYIPIPYLLKYTVDSILLSNKSYNELYRVILALILIHIIRYFILILSQYKLIKIQTYIVNTMKASIIKKIMNLPMNFFQTKEKGYILSRISECGNIGNLFSNQFINVLTGFFDFIISLFMVCILNVKLTILVVIVIPLYFYLIKQLSNKISNNTKLMFESNAILDGKAVQILNGVEEIKLLNANEFHLDEFNKRIKDVKINTINQNKYLMFFIENINLINNLFEVLILLFSGILIFKQKLTLGTYTAFTTYMIRIFNNIQLLTSTGVTLKPICISIDRVHEILDLEEENFNNLQKIDEEIKSISINDITFRYKETGKNILNNVNMMFNKGDKILIKGNNGAGKSTLMKILLGLYYPNEGNILVNNKDILYIDKKELRERIGVISQDIFLFNGTVLENILYGKKYKNRNDVIDFIEKYNLEKYIDKFENGLDTVINEKSLSISGGQAQLIAFLRATIFQRDILIIDEGTSNMDHGIRELIYNMLDEKNLANIVILISHQKEEIRFINKVIYL